MNEPRRGALAYCSLGHIGLILCDEPQEVTYPDGSKGKAWVGCHLWPFHLLGKPWSSRNPEVFACIYDEHEGVFEYLNGL